MLSPNKLTEVEDEQQYDCEILNRFTALEDLDTEVHINNKTTTKKLRCHLSPRTNYTDRATAACWQS
jgi:hypothetical protein